MDFMANIRAEDLEEVQVSGRDLKDTPLSELLEIQCQCLVDEDTDEVYSIGSVYVYEQLPVAWLLCTTRVETGYIKWLRATRKLAREELDRHDYFCNTVYKKNTLHVKWLEWLGAQFFDETPTHITFCLRKENANV